MKKIRILFICHGNICRSPLAEYLMRQLAEEAGLSEYIETSSAAVSSEELGNPVYPPMRRLMVAKGLDCSGKTARKMTKDDYDKYDLLVCMDKSNLYRMNTICGGDPENKFRMLLEYAGLKRDVADPWYSGDFNATWDDVLLGCKHLLAKIAEL